jgi:Tol biopolymer transport system component
MRRPIYVLATIAVAAIGGASAWFVLGGSEAKARCVNPDWIAFIRNTDVGTDIYRVRPDGSELTQVTFDGAAKNGVDWSPDCSQLVYSVGSHTRNDIWLVDFEGTRTTKITDGPGANEFPAWSPKGDLIAFSSDRTGSPELYTMRPDGSGVRRLTTNLLDFAAIADWSADGTTLALSGGSAAERSLILIDEDGSNVRYLSLPGSACCPSWAPAGSEIAIGFASGLFEEIFITDSEGALLQKVTKAEAESPLVQYQDFYPSWSPDSSRLVYSSILYPELQVSDGSTEGGVDDFSYELFVVDRDGRGKTQITFDGGTNIMARWSPP